MNNLQSFFNALQPAVVQGCVASFSDGSVSVSALSSGNANASVPTVSGGAMIIGTSRMIALQNGDRQMMTDICQGGWVTPGI